MTRKIMRGVGLVLLVALGPAVFGCLLIACFLALLWVWSKLAAFQYWGLTIGVVCYLSMSGMIVYALRLTRQNADVQPPPEPPRE